ncbi:hypothetical protein BKA65DRAFT_476891 [Rhexocercosporidium sp. MPI-PUGE-AT-0058]|nr:hypothetical protein BKA65DRAFT_476891 [Rhexocercosporidium sp. MPI-PUGE-AT-0058]
MSSFKCLLVSAVARSARIMSRQRFIVVILGFLTIATTVTGINDFNPAFPTTFSFNETTSFFWLDNKGSQLATFCHVRSPSDQSLQFFEAILQLTEHKVDPQGCIRTTIVDKVTTCVLWVNNGTATFGGSYAAKLIAGRLYHVVINYEIQANDTKGTSESPVFRMINPLPSPTSTGSPTSTSSSSTQSSASTSTSTSSTTTSPASSGPASLPNTFESPSTTPTLSPTQPSTPQKGLTPGMKAGITIGALSLVVIAFLAIFFLHRKRQAKKKSQPVELPTDTTNPPSRNTGINLDDIAITLGSPVTYERVYEGRRGWHKREELPPLVVPKASARRGQNQQEMHGSPF